MKKTGTYMVIAILSVVCPILFVAWFICDNLYPKKIYLENVSEIKAEGYIENASIENKMIKIRGWVLEKGSDLSIVDRKIVLVSEKTNDAYELNTTMEIRPDVTEYFDDGYNYDCCGYTASGKITGQMADNDEYELFVLIKDAYSDSHIWDTGEKILLMEEN